MKMVFVQSPVKKIWPRAGNRDKVDEMLLISSSCKRRRI